MSSIGTPTFTPGPWAWRGQGKHIRLMALHSGQLFVLGTQSVKGLSAEFLLRRADECTMEPASKFAIAGPEHHRGEVLGIDHPDAHLIAAAPDLYEALKEVLLVVEASETGSPASSGERWDAAFDAARAALAKAEGRPS